MLSTSADMAEVLAYAGLDFLVLGREHGQGSIDDAIGQLWAMKGSDCFGVLPTPSNDHIYIEQALDAGVGGIMVPNVNSAAEAQRVVCLPVPACPESAAPSAACAPSTRFREMAAIQFDHPMVRGKIERAADAVPASA